MFFNHNGFSGVISGSFWGHFRGHFGVILGSFPTVCATVWSDGLVGRFGRTVSSIGRRICRREAIFLSEPGDCFVGGGAICLSETGDLFLEGGDLIVGGRKPAIWRGPVWGSGAI